jgi:hypothetical protein
MIVDDISCEGAAARQSADQFLGSGAILRNRDGCVERLKKGTSPVDVGASLLKTVEERPSGGGEGGVEFVARIVSRDFEDACWSKCRTVRPPFRDRKSSLSRYGSYGMIPSE